MKSQIGYWKAVLTTCAETDRCSLHMQHVWDLYMMANNMANRVVGMADRRKIRRCYGEERLEGYTNWRVVCRQGELLSDIGTMVLARRMDKGSNSCIKVRKASTGILKDPKWYKSIGRCFEIRAKVWPDTSGETNARCPVRSSKNEKEVDVEELYNDGGATAEMSLFHS
ncbi:hypothetical protein Acr_29g0010660 [Actinidia rufa]|uniref:Uncharacterized protein n=1 Tax=Actinidia rufa TaxID=165716 RepID=A0A7J0HGF7_9ERIC|nr:hypothetical protein Acr_29g0010660 [Actinidia rufa]